MRRRDRFRSGSAPSKYISRGLQTAATLAVDLERHEISLDAARRAVFLKIRLFGAKTLNLEEMEPVRRRDRFRPGSAPSIYIFRALQTEATQAVDLERLEISLGAARRAVFLKIRLFGTKTLSF